MKHLIVSLACLALLAGAAQAQCYADYKAKRDNPLRLHYGVAELRSGCGRQSARAELEARLAARGWKLLQVMNVFGPEGLAQRKDSAGRFYLRF